MFHPSVTLPSIMMCTFNLQMGEMLFIIQHNNYTNILQQIHGSFHKLCTRWQNCGVDDAIPMKVMPVTVEDMRKQHVCSLLP